MVRNTKLSNQSGHFHMIALLVLVVAVIAAAGWFVYQQNYKPSKVTDADTKAQLKQVSSELKSVDLGTVKKTVDTVSGVKGSYDFKKANE